MRPAWRLAINSLSARGSRTALLVGAVALSAALISSIACAMASVNGAIRRQVESTVGPADLRVRPAGDGETVPVGLLERVRAWPEVRSATGTLTTNLSVSFTRPVMAPGRSGGFVRVRTRLATNALATGFHQGAPWPFELVAGRLPEKPGEVVIDQILASRLSAEGMQERGDGVRDGFKLLRAPPYKDLGGRPRDPVPESTPSGAEAARINDLQRVQIGDRIEVVRQTLPEVGVPAVLREALGRFQEPKGVTVVGVARQPLLGGRPQLFATLETVQELTGREGRLSQIDIVLRPGIDPDAAVEARRGELAENLLLQTSEKVTSGLDANLRSSELGFVLASVLAFLSAAFIITTGLTTGVMERQRELAILRCIGGTRAQLGWMQVFTGLLVGAAGGIAGVPAGIGLAAALAWFFRETIPTGLVVPPLALVLGGAGSLAAGLLGAAWPAWRASRMSPLEALASRAAAARPRGIVIVTALGALGLAIQLASVGVPDDGQVAFWSYATVGLPAMFVGYFLLGVPATLIVVRALAGPVSALLGLPPRMLGRTVGSTPYRHGFTAGALMAGLALMIAIWTNGGAMLRDWLDKIRFPDAFVSGPALGPEHQAALEAMPFVERTAAVTLHQVDTDAFGVRALQQYRTTFVAFEPRPFFEMTTLAWVQGDPETALRRLEEGGAVIVAREFLVAQGMGVGETFTATHDGRAHTFEIVGVVASPGLEVVSKFFNIGEEFADQALHAVFGSRRDLREKFGVDTIHLIQIDLADGVDDAEAVSAIRRELFGAGILDAGSGRAVKAEIRAFASGMLLVLSSIAVLGMLVACFGVANLIIAGIQARRFEFGVLRAVGAQRGLLARLVLGEAVLVALTAMLLGTLMGVQAAWAGQRLYALLLGLDLALRPPPLPIAAGCLVVLTLTVAASLPAVWRLNRQRPRDLLAAMRG